MRTGLAFLTAIFIQTFLMGCQAPAPTQQSQESWLFVHSESKGVLSQKNGQYSLEFTLDPDSLEQDQILAFTDRPFRKTSTVHLQSFSELWSDPRNDSFANDAPNAALLYSSVDASTGVRIKKEVIVQLKRATYDPTKRTFTYLLNPLTALDLSVESEQIENVSLFIDSWWHWLDPTTWVAPIVAVADKVADKVAGISEDAWSNFKSSIQDVKCDALKAGVSAIGVGIDAALGDEEVDLAGLIARGATNSLKASVTNAITNALASGTLCQVFPMDEACKVVEVGADAIVNALLGAGPGGTVTGVLWATVIAPNVGC